MKQVITITLLAAVLAIIPAAMMWIQHYFAIGLNPFVYLIAITLGAAIVVITIRLLIKKFSKVVTLTPAALFAIGAISCILLIPIVNVAHGNSTLDIHLHDTYYVLPNYYALSVVTFLFVLFATTYYLFEKLSNRKMNNRLGYIHFWATFLIVSFVLGSPRYSGYGAMLRNYVDYANNFSSNSYSHQITFVSILLLLLAIAQLLFVCNLCYSILRNHK